MIIAYVNFTFISCHSNSICLLRFCVPKNIDSIYYFKMEKLIDWQYKNIPKISHLIQPDTHIHILFGFLTIIHIRWSMILVDVLFRLLVISFGLSLFITNFFSLLLKLKFYKKKLYAFLVQNKNRNDLFL